MKRERNRKRKQRPIAAPRSAVSQSTPVAALSARRNWLVRLLAICVPLLLVFGGSELLLRVFGYGFDPHFFKRSKIGGRDFYVANESFGLRFFPRSMARVPPPVVMPAAKAPGTF